MKEIDCLNEKEFHGRRETRKDCIARNERSRVMMRKRYDEIRGTEDENV